MGQLKGSEEVVLGCLASIRGHAACSGQLPFPLRWLFIGMKLAGRDEHPAPAQAIRSLSRIWPGLLLPVPLVTFV